MKLGKAFLLVFPLFLLEPLITQPFASAQDPPSDTVWIAAPYTAFPMGISFPMSVEVTNSDSLCKVIMALALKDTGLVQPDSISWSNPTCLLHDPIVLDERVIDTTKTDTIQLEFLKSSDGSFLPDTSGKLLDLWFTGTREGIFFVDAKDSIEFYPELGSYIHPAFSTDSVRLFSDEVHIVAPDTTLPVGRSFRMSVQVANTEELKYIRVNFTCQDTNLVRLDAISYYHPDTLDIIDTIKVVPDTIELWLSSTGAENYLVPGANRNIIDLWFFAIRDGDFFIDTTNSVEFFTSSAAKIYPPFLADTVSLVSYKDPGDSDSVWIKKDVTHDTIGINAKFPLPLTAFTDEILSGFEIPLIISGNNVPTFHGLTFENSDLKDTILVPDDSTLVEDSTVLIRLELKKQLSETLLDTGDTNRLFNLWLKADSEAGSCSIYSAFVPHLSNLFFIDDTGGFTPYPSGIACRTFSYVPGDITSNDVVNNVDLFYLAVHLFLPPDDTAMGKLIYDPEDLERINSQRAFQRTQIPSEEWDSTFSEILFRGDVNGDSRVDMGDFYIMSRHFQGGTSDDLEYGWSGPQAVGSCNNDTVRLNFRKAYPGQKIQIVVEIYNEDSLAALTIPLQIPDITKIECDSVTLAGRFADLEYFDWEWITWDEDYDENPDNQDILISLSTLGISGFPHMPPSGSSYADSAFILWCTVKDTLLDKSYTKLASLSPSHEISFFEIAKGYACQPQVHKFMVPTVLADYGDAPDCTNPCYADCSFPTLCNTNCCRICGRQGPYHQYDPVCTEWLGTLTNPPDTEWVPMVPDMDQDDLSGTLYRQAGATAWYITPVTVTSDTETYRYLNMLYDVDRDGEWKNGEHTEWVVQNKLIIPSGASTDSIIIGPFEIDQPPNSSDTSWARFTLTRDSIPAVLFDTVGGWDGSGPSGGWDHGETEDIVFENCKDSSEFLIFSVDLDSSEYQVGSEGREVNVTVGLAGTKDEIIQRLSLNWEVFDSSGQGNAIICSYISSDPASLTPHSFDLSIDPSPDTVTFTYLASFPGTSNERISRVLWKVTKDLGGGTKLIATAETKFEETAEPCFQFLTGLEDTLISYYGGVVDCSVLVRDPDNDYPLTVTFERARFESTAVEHAPIFGILGDSTQIFDSKADTAHEADTLYAYTPDDTLLIFHWAADSSETNILRTAKLKAEDTTEAGVEAILPVRVSKADTLLPSDKVWVGRTGVVASKNGPCRVPVEVHNTDSLRFIDLPFIIVGTIDYFDTLVCDSTSRLFNDSILATRHVQQGYHISFPDTLHITLSHWEAKPGFLPAGFGKVFDLIFSGDTTHFSTDTSEPIKFKSWDNITWYYPDFESYEIRVIEKGTWVCGDANPKTPGVVGLADVVFLINYVLKSGSAPEPVEKGDLNCDGVADLVDIQWLINYLFRGGDCPKQCYGCILPPGCED